MNPYLMAFPTVLVSLVFLFYVLRDLHRVQIADAVHEAEFQQKMGELAKQKVEWDISKAARKARSQAELVLKLDLTDEEALPDLPLATQQAQWFVSELSQQERSLGGLGLTLTAAKVEPGVVRLTLSPIERAGSAERVKRVAEEINASSSPLPPGVSAAHAVILAM